MVEQSSVDWNHTVILMLVGLELVLGSMAIIGKVETLEDCPNTGSLTYLPGFVSVTLFEPICLSVEGES